MKTISFSVNINAPKEKVWGKLWSDEGYRQWTAAFTEGSYAESDWNEGSKILFLDPKGAGMFGIIKTKIPYEQMTFEHHGEIKNCAEEKKDWGGATESYHLKENNGNTELTVHLDITEDFEQYFKDTFPKALQRVKEISEA